MPRGRPRKVKDIPGMGDVSDKLNRLSDKEEKKFKVALDNVDKEIISKGKEAVKDFDTKKEVKVNPKLEILKKLVNELNRDSGKSLVKFASEEETVGRIPFGVPEIDNLTGGGIPHKRFSIIWGPKSAGKTTLCYRLIAEAQKQGKVCAFVDIEGTFDKEWAEIAGVDLSKLILGEGFDNAEQAMDFFITVVKNSAADLIIIDSIQALSPKGEQETKKGVEKSLEDDTMALLARKLSQFFRISASKVYNSNAAIVLVGQARTNLGGFIAFDSLSGGHALHHWSSMTMAVRRGAKSDNPTKKTKVDGKTITEEIGFSSQIKLEKRKVSSAVEGTTIEIPFYFETGFLKKEGE